MKSNGDESSNEGPDESLEETKHCHDHSYVEIEYELGARIIVNKNSYTTSE